MLLQSIQHPKALPEPCKTYLTIGSIPSARIVSPRDRVSESDCGGDETCDGVCDYLLFVRISDGPLQRARELRASYVLVRFF